MESVDEKKPAPPAAVAADVENGAVEKHPDEKILQHSHDADEALKAFSGLEGEVIEVDEATNKRLLRIIDRHMMPLMCVIYGMNYLDSMNLLLPATFAFRLYLLTPDGYRDDFIVC